MPDVSFWQRRFQELGTHSVGPGDTMTDAELDQHRQVFLREIQPFLGQLKGPVLDFGCGVGRWVMDLPRPYLGLDLTPEHIDMCKTKFGHLPDVEFQLSDVLTSLPDKSFNSIFTVTVLQHVVEPAIRKDVFRNFARLLNDEGVLLSVEWAEGQREYDWCTSVGEREYRKHFVVERVGMVNHSNRVHDVWLGRVRDRSVRKWMYRILGVKS